MKSESIKELALALSKAQGELDLMNESKAIKNISDKLFPIKKVNACSSLDMPSRFFQKIVFGMSTCWIWRGCVDATGYGRFTYQGENKAHRVSFKLFNNAIPSGMLVLHKCDNRQCVNPEHLFIGTQADNMKDMSLKGRGFIPEINGEKNPMSKLNKDQVYEIRELASKGIKQADLSRKFLVSPMTISRIVRKESWA